MSTRITALKLFALVFTAALFALPAAAQTVKQDGRHVLIVVDDGYIRLDTRSGEIARCTGEPDKLTCRLAADERRAYVDEIERLESRIDRLEERIAQIEAGKDTMPGKENGLALPSDDEIDRALDTTDKIFRRFFGLVRELKRDFEQDQL